MDIEKGCVTLFAIILKGEGVLALNAKHNGPVLLFKPILSHCNCFLKSVATNGKDEHGLQLEKNG